MDPAEAEAYLSKFKADIRGKDDFPDFLKNSRIAEMYVGMGMLVQSLDFFEAASKGFKEPYDKGIYGRVHSTTMSLYASTLDETGDFVNAERIYKEVLEESPESMALGDYAYFLHRRKRAHDEAEKYFIKALTLFPKHASIHLKYAGFLRHVRKDIPRATAHYQEATEANPQYADALGSYASFLHGTGGGDKGQTESLYQRAIEADSTHVNNFCNFGLYLSEELGKFEQAEEMYRAALAVSATHANTLYNYAVLLDSHLLRKDEAEVLYHRCLVTQPRHAFALYNLAVLREEKVNSLVHKSALAKHAIGSLDANKAERSRDSCTAEDAPGQDQKREDHTTDVISAEKEQELLVEVGKLYERAAEADCNDFTALADCGRFLCDKLHDYDRGELFLVASLKLHPGGETALLHLGVLESIHRSNYSKSQQLFDKILEENPHHIACLHQKARMLVAKYKHGKDKGKGKGEKESKSSEQLANAVLDDSFKCYETIIEHAVEPGPYAMEYLSQVVNLGTLKQKLSSVVFVESSKGLKGGQAGDVNQLISILKRK